MKRSNGQEARGHERGVSLLIVLLLASMMVLAALGAAQYALNSLRQAEVRSDATRGLFTAESAFQCVRYWVIQDTDNFSNAAANDVTCGGQDFNFADGNASNGAYNAGTGNATFTLNDPAGSGSVLVTVARDLTVTDHFKGRVIVEGYSDATTGARTVQRLQEYDLEFPVVVPADIMVVTDISGSITGVRQPAGSVDGDWRDMLLNTGRAIKLLMPDGSDPDDANVGIVAFGTSIADTGSAADIGGCVGCARTADVPLTTIIDRDTQLLDPGTGFIRLANINETHTNVSLGLAIAASELMSRYYPVSGDLAQPINYQAGYFEQLVANNLSFGLLANRIPASDRQDGPPGSHPDYIILVTDGDPNALVSDGTMTLDCNGTYDGSSIPAGLYEPGDTKLFDTGSPGPGCFIDPATAYNQCNDADTHQPIDRAMSATLNSPAKCNAYYVAQAIQDVGIPIGVIGVGQAITGGTEAYLRTLASPDPLDATKQIYVTVTDYNELPEAMRIINESLQLRVFR